MRLFGGSNADLCLSPQLKSIFEAIGVHMTGDTLDKVFDKAAELHPHAEVGIEAFRTVLDAYQADQIKSAMADRKTLSTTA